MKNHYLINYKVQHTLKITHLKLKDVLPLLIMKPIVKHKEVLKNCNKVKHNNKKNQMLMKK